MSKLQACQGGSTGIEMLQVRVERFMISAVQEIQVKGGSVA